MSLPRRGRDYAPPLVWIVAWLVLILLWIVLLGWSA